MYSIFKIFPYFFYLFIWFCGCSSKNDSGLNATASDITTLEVVEKKLLAASVVTPIDTIIASYPNGKKLELMILAYHDSLPGKPIKDFEVRDAGTKDLIFKSVSKRLALGYETDPMKGEFDSLFVVPTYSIASINPLTMDLDFMVFGGLSFTYIGDLTYPFYKESAELKFLRYTFPDSKNLAIESTLLFTPHECGIMESELVNKFNKIKSEGNLDTENGGELMKSSFICFLNEKNTRYEMIDQEFKQAFGESYFPYNYYVYIVYLDKFIINLISQ